MPYDRTAVLLAVQEIASHPAVRQLTVGEAGADIARIELELDLAFGRRWLAQGRSPTGVYPREPVRLEFTGAFPGRGPELSLRPDFSRAHPHVQPWLTTDGRVVPCVVDGSRDEFVAAHGVYGLIDQLEAWLIKAAQGNLMDLAQGWEPMRRDSSTDTLVTSGAELRGLGQPEAGFAFMHTIYLAKVGGGFTPAYFGQTCGVSTVKIPPTEEPSVAGDNLVIGTGRALVIWSGHDAAGDPFVVRDYLPDDVGDLTALKGRAKAFGVAEPLQRGLAELGEWAQGPEQHIYPVPILILVRRPAEVIGAGSPIEICGYLAALDWASGRLLDAPGQVRPLGHREAISPELLQRMSGQTPGLPWALLGCGSLGSKIALHGARGGAGPRVIADQARLAPHNAARHGLYPTSTTIYGWLGSKARELASVLEPLGNKPDVVMGDHRALLAKLGDLPAAARPKWLVNTTASTIAREALAAAPTSACPRVAEACLFDAGGLGYFAVEGPGRNPDCAELMVDFYQKCRETPSLKNRLFKPDDQVRSITVGQGCASVTMVMSDARLSVMAGVIGEQLAALDANQAGGLIHALEREGGGLRHRVYEIEPFGRVSTEGLAGWTLSISSHAAAKIDADISRYPDVETGGVLLGWRSAIARRMVVIDVLEAPPDSVRSASEFVLGQEGLKDQLIRIAEETTNALVCLGTWHSHLGPATPSGVDRRSAAIVGLGEPRPMAFLIRGADGFRAISASIVTGAREVRDAAEVVVNLPPDPNEVKVKRPARRSPRRRRRKRGRGS